MLDDTLNDPAANSFVSEEFADAYFADRNPVDPVWIPDAPENAPALISACTIMELSYAAPRVRVEIINSRAWEITSAYWIGEFPEGSDQALSWGRVGAIDHRGVPIPDGTIPIALKYAQCEIAATLRNVNRLAELASTAAGLTKLKADVVELTFADAAMLPPIPPVIVDIFLRGLLRGESILATGRRLSARAIGGLPNGILGV